MSKTILLPNQKERNPHSVASYLVRQWITQVRSGTAEQINATELLDLVEAIEAVIAEERKKNNG